MPKIEEHTKDTLWLRKGEQFLFWILHKMNLFLGICCQSNIVFSVVHVQVCVNRRSLEGGGGGGLKLNPPPRLFWL